MCTADKRPDTVAVFTTWVRRRLPFIGGINIILAHQLPRKPMTGAGASL